MKILSRPKGNAEEYGRWSLNPYIGCPHACHYCYLKKGVWAKKLGGNEPQLKNGLINDFHAYHVAMAEIIENREQIISDGGLFASFVTDPFCEPCVYLFLTIIYECVTTQGVPVTVLTKSIGFRELEAYQAIVSQIKQGVDIPLAIGFTLTGHDELEPHAPNNEARLEEMAHVSDDGITTWASIEPVIDFDTSYKMIIEALDAGCQHFKIGLLTDNTRVSRHKYDLAEAMSFTGYVMEATYGHATVYWKQSFYDFFGSQPRHGMTSSEFLHQWRHSVDKDYNTLCPVSTDGE